MWPSRSTRPIRRSVGHMAARASGSRSPAFQRGMINRIARKESRMTESWINRMYRIVSCRSRLSAVLGLCLTVAVSFTAHAEEIGVSANRIVFGQVAALTGPATALGTGMREGILAAFAEANKAGGVQGRELILISMDDGYEPNNTMVGASKLINEDNVF